MSRFESVPPQPDWPALEREVLAWWAEVDAFGKLVRQNAAGEPWSFLDGPITANNPMAVHHAWGRTYKDVWQRFKAMQGHHLRYQNGFDCQGLWVEVNVERELGFKSKHDIEDYGIADFVRRCKERVLCYAAVQTEQSIRLGMWMQWDDPATLRWLADHIDEPGPLTVETCEGQQSATVEWLIGQMGHSPWCGSYFTFSDENNYMIWHFLKACHDRGWIYQGTDVMPWCARCGTGLSQHEIATEGYRELTHRSPTVRFPLVDRPGESLLVWTTTPWTLAGNVAAAVGPALTYLRVRQGDEVFYLAEGAAGAALQGDFEVLGRLPGSEMVGWRYRGPLDELPAQAVARDHHRVIPWDEVGEDEGTGIVHIAPGSGAEDFVLGKEYGLPAIAPLAQDGRYLDGFGWLTGREAGEVGDEIVAHLDEQGLLYRAEPYSHRYPVCWRCGSELLFRLVDEWFISMGRLYDKPRAALTAEEKAASLRYQMMDVVDQIRWIPAFGHERELDWLHNMQDWMISKKRYWGLALPIWRCEACDWFSVVGSREELELRAVAGWAAFDGHSPHRPFVDEVKIRCEACGGTASRILDVGNPWLDAGIVPYSTMHYRLDPEHWRRWFPAEFITECFPGQFRNWFYSLLAMSTVLENTPPFKTVLGYASLLGEDGREMHKSWGNAVEFNEAADHLGADIMRWLFLAQRPEQNLLFGYGLGNEVRRQFFIPLWNVYAFFVQYANVTAGWSPPELDLRSAAVRASVDSTSPPLANSAPSLAAVPPPDSATGPATADGESAELDRWIRLRLAQCVAEVTSCLDHYTVHLATAAIEAFIEDLSNWYIRRSRRRFWDGEPAALDTLYEVLTTLTRLLAPFIPFAAETIYQNLVRAVQPAAPESVHHTRWPEAAAPDEAAERLLAGMALVMRLAGLGRAARSSADVKLRQPLAKATVAVRSREEAEVVARLASHLASELNVKDVEVMRDEGRLVTFGLRPVLPLLGPKYGPRVPAIRAALEAADASAVAARVAAGEAVPLEVAGEMIELLPDEIEVVASARGGLVTAQEGGYVVAVATELTDELRAEGLARDLVRHVQQLRKDSGLAITDRVHLTVDAPAPIAAAVDAWRDYISGEVLALALDFGPPVADADGSVEVAVEGLAVALGVRRV